MKCLEMNEWKEMIQECSLNILMWNTNNQQYFFIKYVIFGIQRERES